MTFHNPFEDSSTISGKVASPCIMVIFGATGDLTGRKLLPALYNVAREGQLPPHFACVGFARRDKSHEDFRKEMHEAVSKFSRSQPIDESLWESFSEQIFYHQSEFHDDAGYESLRAFLKELDSKFDTKGNRIFYLSTQPSFFPLIVEKLHKHKLLYHSSDGNKWSRVVIEKPFGYDLQSAQELQSDLVKYLDESQIYRIDHYLGKETVQNLMTFRFTNPIFESVWSNKYIDHVQITVGEEIGIGSRGHFFEEAGMLRDIVQNHMMQLLSMICIEPPINLSARAIHEEKVKVMQSIRPFPKHAIDQFAVRGQYNEGFINGVHVSGYREENNVSPRSIIETFAALELFIDNERWSGVSFYLRAGKRLPKRTTEIVITFKEAPTDLLKDRGISVERNILVIRIQPDEGISFKMNCKVPGLTGTIQPVKMDFKYGAYFGLTAPEAYERLLCDCMAGDSTLFARADEVMTAWRLLTPVLHHWKNAVPDFPNYHAGTWGPKAADALLARNGRKWRLP